MEPSRAIADLRSFSPSRLDIAREIGSGFSHCIFRGSWGTRLYVLQDFPRRVCNRNVEWKSGASNGKRYQAHTTNTPVENGRWSKARKGRHDLSGTLVSVTTAPVEENGYIRSAHRHSPLS